MLQAITDTNALLSGLLWHGAPHVLLKHVRAGMLALVSSPAILAELAIVIVRPKFEVILARSNTSRKVARGKLRPLAEGIELRRHCPASIHRCRVTRQLVFRATYR